uniref:Uncharacterized protein n=1 Tax=Zea mays TaxID=4577 RepID=A0A804N4H0_MAIZE
MQIFSRSTMLSLLRLRSSVAATPSTAQYAASAHLPAVLWRSLPPALARRASPCPLTVPPDPPTRRVVRFRIGSRSSMATTTTSGIKGDDDETSSLAKACNDEQDGRTAAVHGDKHTRKKTGHDIFLRCGDGPPGERTDDEELRRLEEEEERREKEEEDDDDQHADYQYNYPDEDVRHLAIFPYSTHRDGSIYRNAFSWRKMHRIENRNETRIEAMTLSDPKDCMHCKGKKNLGSILKTCCKFSP